MKHGVTETKGGLTPRFPVERDTIPPPLITGQCTINAGENPGQPVDEAIAEKTNRSALFDEEGSVRVLGKDTESVQIITSQLEEAIDALFDVERQRQQIREWVLVKCRQLDHIPQNLRERLDLILRFRN